VIHEKLRKETPEQEEELVLGAEVAVDAATSTGHESCLHLWQTPHVADVRTCRDEHTLALPK
jgi:hypothetical protein